MKELRITYEERDPPDPAGFLGMPTIAIWHIYGDGRELAIIKEMEREGAKLWHLKFGWHGISHTAQYLAFSMFFQCLEEGHFD
jgi:hypothetical protein